jgi:hypothetical protein
MSTEIDTLRKQIATLQARLDTTAKDMSLVTLIQTWSGTAKSVPLQGFINSVETTADIGNWTDKDKIRVMTLKLTDVARSFYDATPALHDKEVTWKNFKTAFENRFRDNRSDQYHFLELQRARQMADESIRDFSDRVVNLGRKITPQLDDPNAQHQCNVLANKMIIAAFTEGLRGNPGNHARIAVPTKMEDAVNIALTVEQAEASKKQGDTFYVGNRSQKPSQYRAPENRRGRDEHSRREKDRVDVDWEDAKMTCFDCGGKGHRSKDCATRKAREEAQGKPPREKYQHKKSYRNPEKWRSDKGQGKPSGN